MSITKRELEYWIPIKKRIEKDIAAGAIDDFKMALSELQKLEEDIADIPHKRKVKDYLEKYHGMLKGVFPNQERYKTDLLPLSNLITHEFRCELLEALAWRDFDALGLASKICGNSMIYIVDDGYAGQSVLRYLLKQHVDASQIDIVGTIDEITDRERLILVTGARADRNKHIRAQKLSFFELREFDPRDYKFYQSLPEAEYAPELEQWFFEKTKQRIDLSSPVGFFQKLQWLKIFGASDAKKQLTDKILMREWIKDNIGDKYVIPLLGMWKDANDIDVTSLPKSFVLACNHGYDWKINVANKDYFDEEASTRLLSSWMKQDYAFVNGLELPYHGINPVIMAEEYMDVEETTELSVHCFAGKPLLVQTKVSDSIYGDVEFEACYDASWRKIPFTFSHSEFPGEITRPENLDEILKVAETISNEFEYVCIRFYSLKDRIYVKDINFSPNSGLGKQYLSQMDRYLGELLHLPCEQMSESERIHHDDEIVRKIDRLCAKRENRKVYMILTANIHKIGGMQMYSLGKAQYLEKNGWDVYIFYGASPEGTCEIPALNKYVNGGVHIISKPPENYDAKRRNSIIEKMIEVSGCQALPNTCVIESQSDCLAIWGEMLARRLGARHMCMICNERFRGPDKHYVEHLDLFDFKHKRRELAGINEETLVRLFEGYKEIPEQERYTFFAAQVDPVQCVENKEVEKLEKADYNICYIGRSEKNYFSNILDGVLQFALKYKEKSIYFILVGDAESKREQIAYLTEQAKNLTVIPLGNLSPIPATLYQKVDVVIAGSGCALYSMGRDVPIILADAGNGLANGVLGYDTHHVLYSEEETIQMTYDVALERALVSREYLSNDFYFPVRDVEKEYKNQVDMISMTDAHMRWFDFGFGS